MNINVFFVRYVQSMPDLFGNVVPVDGHDFVQLKKAFQCSKKGTPTVIVADTIKGKGIPSIENREQLHHMRLSQEDYEKYAQELEASYA
jgi:transketolase